MPLPAYIKWTADTSWSPTSFTTLYDAIFKHNWLFRSVCGMDNQDKETAKEWVALNESRAERTSEYEQLFSGI
jgi:hypothetical protein